MDPVFSSSPSPQPQTPLVPENSYRQQDRLRLIIVGIVVAIIVGLLGAGAYWWLQHRQPTNTAHTSTTGTTAGTSGIAPGPIADASTDEYVSNGRDLNLSFSYPSSWSVEPPANTNSQDQTITATSPLIRITDTTDKSVTGRIVVNIRPGGSPLNELAGGQATAGQASAQIGYDKPTSAQHQYPYLTYIHLPGGSNPSGAFEEVMITGVMALAKDQPVMSVSLAQIDPIVSARFYSCSNQSCLITNAAPLSITNSIWISDAACLQTLAIFKSLQIN